MTGDAPAGSPPRACGTCGAPAPTDGAALLAWSRAVELGREVWTCPDCARRHVRSIEGKLDHEWW